MPKKDRRSNEDERKTDTFQHGNMLYNGTNEPCIREAPYQAGDILYVRETWCDDRQFTRDSTPGQYFYKASENGNFKWKPSIHMPKEAARIWLKITDVRVERLQDLTSQEAWKEGARCSCLYPTLDCAGNKNAFIDIWNSTIKKSDLDRYGWAVNPWVWVIAFEPCEKPENQEN